jgi:hypothetical protein
VSINVSGVVPSMSRRGNCYDNAMMVNTGAFGHTAN